MEPEGTRNESRKMAKLGGSGAKWRETIPSTGCRTNNCLRMLKSVVCFKRDREKKEEERGKKDRSG